MSFKEQLGRRVDHIEEVLTGFLPKETGYQKTVLEAMNYSVTAGGKRLRPMIMEECFKLFGGEGEIVYPFMAALEMIHNYSLVHDDLPAMDNDMYRRGRKTTWTVYGEGMAVLAGDGLLNLAYETAAKAFDMTEDITVIKRVAKALQILGNKAGVYGMIGGQTADIEAEENQNLLTEEVLLFIHENKTAALIQAAMMIGATLAGASDDDVKAMEQVAYNIGIAFQIQDDVLDVISTTEVLGKPVGSDEKNNKLTYVTLKGLETSKKEVERLSREAIETLTYYVQKKDKDRDTFLIELTESLITREK